MEAYCAAVDKRGGVKAADCVQTSSLEIQLEVRLQTVAPTVALSMKCQEAGSGHVVQSIGPATIGRDTDVEDLSALTQIGNPTLPSKVHT